MSILGGARFPPSTVGPTYYYYVVPGLGHLRGRGKDLGSRARVKGLGFRVSGLGIRVLRFGRV